MAKAPAIELCEPAIPKNRWAGIGACDRGVVAALVLSAVSQTSRAFANLPRCHSAPSEIANFAELVCFFSRFGVGLCLWC